MKRKVLLSQIAFFSLAVATAAVHGGCAAVAAGAAVGAGTVAYVRGDLEAQIDRRLDRVHTATKRALDQLEFKQVSDKKDALQAIFEAHNAADKKIEIHLTRTTDVQTKVQIRVGVFGDKDLSLKILDTIRAQL